MPDSVRGARDKAVKSDPFFMEFEPGRVSEIDYWEKKKRRNSLGIGVWMV